MVCDGGLKSVKMQLQLHKTLYIHTAELLWLGGMCPFVSIAALWLCVLAICIGSQQ